MVARGEFFEHAVVHGDLKGTARHTVEAPLKQGRDVLLEIDYQGARQVRALVPDCVSVFILPPSIDELHRRLQGRATDSAEVINARMERARAEISHWDGYDYVIINDDINMCFEKVRAILEAERMKRARQTGLIPFVRGLMG
jgi:guanylate kinase